MNREEAQGEALKFMAQWRELANGVGDEQLFAMTGKQFRELCSCMEQIANSFAKIAETIP